MFDRARSQFSVLLLYIGLTALFLFPLSIQLADHVPDYGDPLENTWVLAWNAHQLALDPHQVYNANIYYPFPNALAFSESQFASSVVAMPIFFATGNAILAYNLVFCSAFVLMGFNMYLLALDVTRHRPAAILAGTAFAFWSYPLNHLSHLNLVTLQYMPLVFFALRRAVRSAGWKYALLFGVSFTAQALSSWYAALMSGLGIALYGIYFVAAERVQANRRGVVQLALVSVLCLVLVGGAALPYFQVNRAFGLERSLDEAQVFAARPATFLTVPSQNRLYGDLLETNNTEALFPGLVVSILAVIGLASDRPARERGFWLLLVAVFALIAFGPRFELSPQIQIPSPVYRALYEWLPGFQGTRAPARFFVMGMMGLCVLAAMGFQSLTSNVPARGAALLGGGALCLVGLEFFAAPLALVPIEVGQNIPAVYRWLAEQPAGNYVEMPLRGGDVEWLTRTMYFSTAHWHSTPLGYGSFAPAPMLDVLNVLNDEITPPGTRLLNLLREYKVRDWIFHADQYTDDEWKKIHANLNQIEGLDAVWQDDHTFVYRVEGDAPAHPLTFSYLAPHFARANEKYTGYLVAQHTRRYPIVNRDLAPHRMTVTWQCPGAQPVTQTFSLTLPPVLRGRPEGVRWDTNAPHGKGECETSVALDRKPLDALDGNARVTFAHTPDQPIASAPLELLAVVPNTREIFPGDTLFVQLAWRALQRVRDDLRAGVMMLDANDKTVYETVEHPLLTYTYPTSQWRANELVVLDYAIPIPADAPPGPYRLTIEVLDASATRQIPFLGMDGLIQARYEKDLIQVKAR